MKDYEDQWLNNWGRFSNYVMPRGGVKLCVTDRSQHNIKKRYEGQKSLKKALSNC